MKHKIIFLDIDGVLNGYNFWDMVGWKIACILNIKDWYKRHTREPFEIHEGKVKRLAKIVKKTGAKVVMSSSWKHGWWKTPYEQQWEDQKKLTDLLNKYNIEVIDITNSSSDGRRDKEIEAWVNEHLKEIYSFVILDDEISDLECFVGGRLIQTSSIQKGQLIKGHWSENTGLKWKHVRSAIKLLENNKIK